MDDGQSIRMFKKLPLLVMMCCSLFLSANAIGFHVNPATSSEATSQNVELSCYPGTLKTLGILIIRISKTDGLKPITAITPNHPATIFNRNQAASTKTRENETDTDSSLHNYIGTVLAEGKIDDESLQKSYLTLTLVNPTHELSGSYDCEVTYLDVTGNIQMAKVQATVKVAKADVRALHGEVEKIGKILHGVEKTLVKKSVTLAKLGKKVLDHFGAYENSTHHMEALLNALNDTLVHKITHDLEAASMSLHKSIDESVKHLEETESSFEKQVMAKLEQQNRINTEIKNTLEIKDRKINELQAQLESKSKEKTYDEKFENLEKTLTGFKEELEFKDALISNLLLNATKHEDLLEEMKIKHEKDIGNLTKSQQSYNYNNYLRNQDIKNYAKRFQSLNAKIEILEKKFSGIDIHKLVSRQDELMSKVSKLSNKQLVPSRRYTSRSYCPDETWTNVDAFCIKGDW